MNGKKTLITGFLTAAAFILCLAAFVIGLAWVNGRTGALIFLHPV